jgi:hypothetical protein
MTRINPRLVGAENFPGADGIHAQPGGVNQAQQGEIRVGFDAVMD